MDGTPKKKALLELRKQIQALIAHEEAEDPTAAHEGHADAAQAMDDSGLADGGLGLNDKPEPTDVQSKFMDYLKPRVKARRPGTGVINSVMAKHEGGKGPEKKTPGKARKEAF